MNIFEATYENMDSLTERKATIEFDGQFLKSDQECYNYAMKKAYQGKQSNECLVKLEFIAC